MSKRQQEFEFAGESPVGGGPVECLGMTFENDEARREYFLERLREKLQDPEFRSIDGFPIADIEDILSLSDPPYFTACPNPFLREFIQSVTTGSGSNHYGETAFAADVSIGRYSAESLAHSYHTKVPARAILRYILHYTKPGDVVLDGFCGTGMTALAAQLCETLPGEERAEVEAEVPGAKWGLRYSVLCDLSPAATFIAANYLRVPQVTDLEQRCDTILARLEQKVGWMYRTDSSTPTFGDARVLHTTWSDVFSCKNCGVEFDLWSTSGEEDSRPIKDGITCPGCHSILQECDLERVFETRFDPLLSKLTTLPKSVPVEVAYEDARGRHSRGPSEGDIKLLRHVESIVPDDWFPLAQMMDREGPWGDTYRAGYCSGTTHAHHFYKARAFHTLVALRRAVLTQTVEWGPSMLLTATALKLTRMMRYMSDGIGRIQNGVIYFPSLSKETNALHLLQIAKKQLQKLRAETKVEPTATAITTGSSANLSGLPDASIDYVFVDPPFGDNLQYSELNFLWECWLRVRTSRQPEAVVSKSQEKDLREYGRLITDCFREFYRVLKAGRWITIEFHNSRNAVWNAIQAAIMEAGFVVADVRVLNKKQGAFNQVVAASAVKKDLVISAYKPTDELGRGFEIGAASLAHAWTFIEGHLRNLPVFVAQQDAAEVLAERTSHMLYDRMIAFFIQRRVAIPVDASEFYSGLDLRFAKRDGMYFLPEQVAEYDRKRASVTEVRQLELFVSDEASATQWVRQQLTARPQSFQDLQPQFMQQLMAWAKHERTIELKEILELNFLRYDGAEEVPSQIHSYLSSNFRELRNLDKNDAQLRAKAKDRWYVPDPRKEGDLEKLRLRTWLKEFEEYRTTTKRKIKPVRMEALRAGFKDCYDKGDHATIVAVAKKIPENVIQEDEKLLMYYDVAVMRLGES